MVFAQTLTLLPEIRQYSLDYVNDTKEVHINNTFDVFIAGFFDRA